MLKTIWTMVRRLGMDRIVTRECGMTVADIR